ncbi:MAG: hypothetical protein KDB16_08290, partial [Acidimicrobiales bacterium]|nr:hypothetical protein [Acidimicrobiales bacterium]
MTNSEGRAEAIPPALLDAAAQILGRDGRGGLSMSSLAREVEMSRVTFHRWGLTVHGILEALGRRLADDWNVGASQQQDAPAPDHLKVMATVLCYVAERNRSFVAASLLDRSAYDRIDVGPIVALVEQLPGRSAGSTEVAEAFITATIATYTALRRVRELP